MSTVRTRSLWILRTTVGVLIFIDVLCFCGTYAGPMHWFAYLAHINITKIWPMFWATRFKVVLLVGLIHCTFLRTPEALKTDECQHPELVIIKSLGLMRRSFSLVNIHLKHFAIVLCNTVIPSSEKMHQSLQKPCSINLFSPSPKWRESKPNIASKALVHVLSNMVLDFLPKFNLNHFFSFIFSSFSIITPYKAYIKLEWENYQKLKTC